MSSNDSPTDVVDSPPATDVVDAPSETEAVETPSEIEVIGTQSSEVLEGSETVEVIVGLSGDDTISGDAGDDIIHGDFENENMLEETETSTSFAQYGETDFWTVQEEADGHTSMTQEVETMPGEIYSINFDMAANHGSGTVSGAVEVLWNGEVIGDFDTKSAAYSTKELEFEGAEGVGELTFRSIESKVVDGPEINTDGPIFSYAKDIQIGGETVEVQAFAEAQSNLYQVLDGKLHIFDPLTSSYTPAGVDATVTTNAIGFNAQDDLLYGIAVGTGTDALGTTVDRADLVMIDATGSSYLVGTTPYSSWTGDFDDEGNLWAFQSSLDRVTKIDVDVVDADGIVASETYKFDKSMVTDSLWDVAYDAQTDSFYGVTRPSSEGAETLLYATDISAVDQGGAPTVETTVITGTTIDGETLDGVPAITFGAAINDADGNLYVAGNSGDHDMNNATSSSGGIYKVVTSEDGDTATLELVSGSPRSRSNDGAADPRASDPFGDVDTVASVLIRNPELEITDKGDATFDDNIFGGQGNDQIIGGLGDDVGAGQSGNDILDGQDGNDQLFGGNSDQTQPAREEYYDDVGNRFDMEGNLLAANNDVLSGGEGQDFLHGGAGHDTLDGGTEDDALVGGSGFDELTGGEGNDQLAGGSERDMLDGGDGDDHLIGSYGADELYGGAGADILQGGSEDDMLDGGLGNDLLQGGVGDDVLIGGAGDDVLEGSTGDDQLSDASGENALSGGSGNDALSGGTGVDMLDGGSGNDVLSGGGARDHLKGGSGNDVLNGGDDKDKLYGGSGDDEINGDQGSDYINAGSGDDIIDAGVGRDKILMGSGADVATGGGDSDWFSFNSRDLDGASNTILDYTRNGSEADRLDFRGLSLVSDAQEANEWFATHVVQQGDDVQITFDAFELTLIDHENQGAAFYDQVLSGMEMF